MSTPVLSDLDFGSAVRIQNLPAPVGAAEPVRLQDLNTAIEGLKQKDPARVRAQANTNIASPGATVDGVAMVAGDRVLLSAQTSQPENGIYIWNGAASAMTRSADASTGTELVNALVPVSEGTDATKTYRQTTAAITIGVTNVVFVQFGTTASQATETSAGIAELATQAETNTGTDDLRIVTPLKLASYTGFTRKFSSTFGDGAATQYDITHNFGTADVQIAVYRISDGVEVMCDMKRQSTNVARLNFAVAPALNTLRCVVVG